MKGRESMKRKFLGLSINENSIRCVALETNNQDFTVNALFEVQFENFDLALNDKEVVESVRTFLKKIRYDEASVSLPASKVLTRIKNVPKIPPSQIVKLIKTEIRDYAIFEGENVSLGFAEIDRNSEGIDIIWAATKESIVLSVLNFLRKIGLKTRRITIPQIALVEFINTFYKEEDNYAIVNVDKDTTTLTISKGKTIIFNYTQDIGFEAFKLNDPSLKGAWVGNIVSSLNYVSRNLNVSVKKIYVSVNDEESFDILSYLSNRVGYPVIMLSIPEDINFDREEDFIRYQKTGGNEFAVPVGLALTSKIKKGEKNYLSITEYFLTEHVSERLKVIATLLVFVVVNGAFIIAFPYFSSSLKSTEEQLSSVLKSISAISKPVEDANKLQIELQKINSTISSLKEVESNIYNMPYYSMVLRELKSLAPSGIELREVSLKEDGSVDLKGVSNSFRSVFSYEENLANARFIKNATILEIEKDKEGTETFTMQMQMRNVK
jgi:Tfp pilus assembly protein PilN